jgi:hypothetical protein
LQQRIPLREAREGFVEVHRRVKRGKPAAGNDYSSRLHAITANRTATREIEILLMDAIVQSFSYLFLKRFGAEILQNLCFPRGFLR